MSSYGFPKKAEDAAHATGDLGFQMLGVRNDSTETDHGGGAGTGFVSADKDYSPVAVNKFGHVKVQVESSAKATYQLATAFATPAASCTDLFEFLGSASKTIKIKQITIAYDCTSSSTANRFFLKKLSAAGSGGTSTAYSNGAGNIVKLDSGNDNATATAKHYTVNPTIATSVAMATVTSCGNSSLNSAAAAPPIVLFDEKISGQPLVLRGTSQGFVINNNGATVANTAPSIAINVIWTEE